ncbi:MAG: HAD family phosphatase [Lachnospiraceae bacterium]|nr:HAD family phosphatase [Lachnospiraceae bacterium]
MIKGAIFDIDGTLLDSLPIWRESTERFLESHGIKSDAELGKALKNMSLEEGSVYIKERYGLDESPEEVRHGILKVISDFYRYEAPLKPGAREFIEKMAERGIPMVLATTSDGESVTAAFKRLGLWDYFGRVFTSKELNTSKREPFIFLKSAEYIGTAPEETVVFEDSVFAIEAANEAGCTTIALWDLTNDRLTDEIKEKADFYMGKFDFDVFEKNFL